MREQAEKPVGATGHGGGQKSGSAGGATITLIVVLLALGALGAASLWALNTAPGVAPTSSQDQLAGWVCTAYQTRNYDLLIANIDPAPVATAPTPFNDNAKKSLTINLQAQDSQNGPVTHCAYQPTSDVSADHLHYAFTLTRAQGHQSTLVMDFVREKDGTWKIGRDSYFTPSGG